MAVVILPKMFSVIIVIVSILLSTTSSQQIGGDTESTMRIVGKLCMPGNHNDAIAYKFFCCYDQAPGKPQFSTCQMKVFGNLLNSEANIDSVCRPPSKFMEYVGCLQSEFKAAGLNLMEAVTKVNICQARVIGLDDCKC